MIAKLTRMIKECLCDLYRKMGLTEPFTPKIRFRATQVFRAYSLGDSCRWRVRCMVVTVVNMITVTHVGALHMLS